MTIRSGRLLAAIVLVLAACGGGEAGTTSPGPSTVESTSEEPEKKPTAAPTTEAKNATPAGGIYIGTVAAPALAPQIEIVGSRVELVLGDGAVEGYVEYTLQWGYRYQNDVEVCTAVVTYAYSGAGSVATSLPMAPESHEIVSLEGPECGIVEGYWRTTAEEDLAAEFAEVGSDLLVGEFAGDEYAGTMTEGVLEVTAVRS